MLVYVRSGHFSWFMVEWLGGVVFIGLVALLLSFVNERGDGGPQGEDATRRSSLRRRRAIAVVGTIVAAILIAVGVVNFRAPYAFLWVVLLLAMAGFNVWWALGRDDTTWVPDHRD
ncbi:MAG TPA: hypothetical protein VGP16_07250 [Asanoa sp.]|nr:hypothetical protein [Asanoa sp.]